MHLSHHLDHTMWVPQNASDMDRQVWYPLLSVHTTMRNIFCNDRPLNSLGLLVQALTVHTVQKRSIVSARPALSYSFERNHELGVVEDNPIFFPDQWCKDSNSIAVHVPCCSGSLSISHNCKGPDLQRNESNQITAESHTIIILISYEFKDSE